MGQTAYTSNRALGIEGQLHTAATNGRVSLASNTAVRFGLLVSAQGTNECEVIPAPPAADPDAIIDAGDSVASAASIQRIVAAGMTGAVGGGSLFGDYARNLTITLNSHADWDQSTGYVHGLDRDGNEMQEAWDLPNGGNLVVLLHSAFSQVDELLIPIQTGTNGTVTMGTGVEYGSPLLAIGVAIADMGIEGPSPGVTAVGYPVDAMVSILTKGLIWVTTFDAVVDGQLAYVRYLVADSGKVVGEWGGSADGTFAAPEGAPVSIGGKLCRWRSAAAIDGFALLEVG